MTSPTQHALNKLAAARQRVSSKAHHAAMGKVPHGQYDGAELLPCLDRPSSMRAHALPSRRNNRLRWPDGSWTDLHGTPVESEESGLPVFGSTKRAEPTAAQTKMQKFHAALEYRTKENYARASKLTEDDVRDIRQMLEAGKSKTEIAAKYSVQRSTVSKIESGQTWSHVK